jgi:hypothetical protein
MNPHRWYVSVGVVSVFMLLVVQTTYGSSDMWIKIVPENPTE